MRILVVVHGFPPAAQGGSEIYAFEHARALHRRHGDEVLVLTREQDRSRGEYSVREERRDGLSIAWVNNTFRSTTSFEETYRNPTLGSVAERIIDRFRPDVAHVHHLTCLSTTIVPALADRHVPVFFTLHDYWLMCHRGQLLDLDYRVCNGPEPSGCHRCVGTVAGVDRGGAAAAAFRAAEARLPPRPARFLRQVAGRIASLTSTPEEADRHERARTEHMRDVCARVTHFIAPSRCMRDRFVRFGIAPDRISVSGYGFDHAPFVTVRRTPSGRLRLGFLGSLMISKAPHVLLEAVRKLPAGRVSVELFGADCAYHGDDSYRHRLEPLLQHRDVHGHGPISHDHVAEALSAVDVLVVPSIWPENSPLVIQEAFLAGVPVVASRIGGIPEVVHDGRNGLLFEAGDPEDLSRVLTRLLEEPALLATLRANIPPVRSIEEDVQWTRGMYDTALRRTRDSQVQTPSAARSKPDRLAAVVLNYRTPDDTLLAVKSLLASTARPDLLIVVDNDRTEDCRQILADVWRDIVYVHTGRNLGFSGGVNVGIRTALERGADAVALVNSDVIVSADCLERLACALADRPAAGIVGPLVLARSEPDRVASFGVSFSRRTGRMRQRGAGVELRALALSDRQTVDAVSGCLMMIRREVFDAIGLFDEEYFFTFEDLDFCFRAREAGFATVLEGTAVAYHEGSRSIGPGSPRRIYFATRNHLMLGSRVETRRNPIAAVGRTVSILLLNAAHAAISTSGSVSARLSAFGRGVRDYVTGRVGDEPPSDPASSALLPKA